LNDHGSVAIGGAGMGTVLAHFGIEAAFTLQVTVLFLIALFPLLFRERAGEKLLPWTPGEANIRADEVPDASVRELTRNLWRAFQGRGPILGVLFAAVNAIMVGMMNAVNPVFCVQEVGWTQEAYSQIDGGVGALAGVAGAIVGGFLVDRMGVLGLISMASVAIAGVCVTLGLSDALRVDDTAVTAYIVLCNVLVSAQTVAGFSLFMRLCHASVGGTQFTLYMAAANFARVISAVIVGALAAYGYGTMFLVMGGAMLAALPVLYFIPESRRARAEPTHAT
jgi:PAT family beta-lactamase induction signal transducer AmpG